MSNFCMGMDFLSYAKNVTAPTLLLLKSVKALPVE
jgi:hypothetical protein